MINDNLAAKCWSKISFRHKSILILLLQSEEEYPNGGRW